MPLSVPKLDDLDFQRIFEEARALIPRYAPDWTDHNLHDPGITLIDLMAFLIDQQVYTVGFVGDRHVAAFASLLGVSRRTAQPAHGLIWPGAAPSSGGTFEAGTAISSIELPELPFLLAERVHLTLTPVEDWRLEDSVLTLTFGRPPVGMTLDDRPAPIAIGVEISNEEEPAASPGYLVADYSTDGGQQVWRRLEIKDGTAVLHRTGVLLVQLPPVEDADLCHLRISVRGRLNPLSPRIRRIQTDVLPVEQAIERPEQQLGKSTGFPHQEFDLESETPEMPFIVDPANLAIDAGGEAEDGVWKSIPDLTGAGPDDRRFELRIDEGKILFGNGVNGSIPTVDAQIMRRPYRRTCGELGNVAAGLKWRLPNGEIHGTNRSAFSGGADPWNIEELRSAAQRQARRLDVLLTDEDLSRAAGDLAGMNVAHADVRSGRDPALPGCSRVPGSRTLFVMPKRSPNADRLQPVSPDYVRAVARALEPRRVLGERLAVLAPVLVPVQVQARLSIDDGLDASAIVEQAIDLLDARLSALPVEGSHVEPWPSGRPVDCEEMIGLLAGIPGVASVSSCRLSRDGQPFADETIELDEDEIAIGRDHGIEVVE